MTSRSEVYRIQTRELANGRHAAIHDGQEILRSASPILDAARYFLRRGAAEDALLVLVREDGRSVRAQGEMGRLAKLAVVERDKGGIRFAAYRPYEMETDNA